MRKETEEPEKEVRLSGFTSRKTLAKSFHLETSTGSFQSRGTPLMRWGPDRKLIRRKKLRFRDRTQTDPDLRDKVSDADMEKGQLRCDCNISLRRNRSGTRSQD